MKITLRTITPFLLCVSLLSAGMTSPALACCAVAGPGTPVVNADQSVIIIWDHTSKQQHFIRKAGFKTTATDVGFLVPTPSKPDLQEAGSEAFPYLAQITAPMVSRRSFSIGCSAAIPVSKSANWVHVVEEETVAGFHAVVLASDSGTALSAWLQARGYHLSPEVTTWAEPYLDQRWYITAMKVAADKNTPDKPILADALRISFKTNRPLFPYREPDSLKDARKLNVEDRLLRIYFIGETRYAGTLGAGHAWSGKPVWSGPLQADQKSALLQKLRLPSSTGPQSWWLTEFEDDWKYGTAPSDLYFTPAGREPLRRPVEYARHGDANGFDLSLCATVGIAVLMPLRRKRTRSHS